MRLVCDFYPVQIPLLMQLIPTIKIHKRDINDHDFFSSSKWNSSLEWIQLQYYQNLIPYSLAHRLNFIFFLIFFSPTTAYEYSKKESLLKYQNHLTFWLTSVLNLCILQYSHIEEDTGENKKNMNRLLSR